MSQKKKLPESKNKRLKITLKLKREIIDNREQGVSVADLARKYNRPTSTICTILKNKDKIKEVDASKGVTRISAQRLPVLDDVERLLLAWINENELQTDSINESVICEKAKMIFADLIKKMPASSAPGDEAFKASRGWFEKFKRRTGIQSVVRQEDTASSDAKAGEHFLADFKKLIDSEGYLQQQVFSESRPFRKRNPKRTYITTEPPEQEPIKDHLTLEENVEEEDEAPKQQSSSEIKEMLKAWETVASYIEKHHPNKEMAVHAIDLFKDNALSHFYQILKRRRKPISSVKNN